MIQGQTYCTPIPAIPMPLFTSSPLARIRRDAPLFVVATLLAASAFAEEPVIKDDAYWFDRDWEEQARNINEGELRFLASDGSETFHRTENIITIDSDSRTSGWIGIRQCHYQLDAVADTEIVYQYPEMGPIRVISARGIGRITPAERSVALRDVQKDAELCLAYAVRHLQATDTGWVLGLGPYYRGYLDGFYPMHVKIEVRYPAQLMSIAQV